MDPSTPTRAAGRCDPAAGQPASTDPGHAGRPGPARGRRLLAGAMAAASLATGLNALVQAAKGLTQFWPR